MSDEPGPAGDDAVADEGRGLEEGDRDRPGDRDGRPREEAGGRQPEEGAGQGDPDDGSPREESTIASDPVGEGAALAQAEPADAEPGATSGEGESESALEPGEVDADPSAGAPDVPADVRNYDRFQKMDRASYERVNEFLRDRTYITAREWAIARLCADFRTATGVEMTKIGENLPHLVPFMTDTYSPQAVNQARSAFEEKVRMAGATFLYGAMSGFFTADDLDDLMYEVTEIAKFLLEVESVELAVEEELEAEDRISEVMREVRQASDELRHEGVHCPECGTEFEPEE